MIKLRKPFVKLFEKLLLKNNEKLVQVDIKS